MAAMINNPFLTAASAGMGQPQPMVKPQQPLIMDAGPMPQAPQAPVAPPVVAGPPMMPPQAMGPPMMPQGGMPQQLPQGMPMPMQPQPHPALMQMLSRINPQVLQMILGRGPM